MSDISSIVSQTDLQQPSSPLQAPKQQAPEAMDDSEVTHVHRVTTPGYKLVLDNIDSTLRPRYMCEDAQNLAKSLTSTQNSTILLL